jgi:hypothetical protein
MGVHQVDASNYALKMDTWAKSYSFAWTGGWVHIAASCDSATTTCKAYVNGVLVGTESITNSLYYLDTLGSPVGYCRSLLDEWGVWNRALSDSDIASLYNGGAGKTYPF